MIRQLLPKAHIKNPSQDINFIKEKGEEILESKENWSYYQPYSYLPALFSLNSLSSKFIGLIHYLKFNPLIPQSNRNVNTLFTSYLSGINIRLAGRLMTQKMRPRFTVQNKQSGSLARVKVDHVEKARFTGKNKRGAFSFTVTIGHVMKS